MVQREIGSDFVDAIATTSGARAIVVRDDSLPLVALSIRVSAGSVQDPPGKSGVAHVLEHLMFGGTKRHARGEHLTFVQANGGFVNAKASADWTKFFHITAPEMLPDILHLEAERFAETCCALNAENLAAERQIVLAERLQRITNKAYGDAYERIFGAMFPAGSPSRLLPIGLAADVQRISVDDCRQFIAAHYLASNVNVAIVGAVDPASIQRPLEELLGSFGPGHGPEPAAGEATAECSRQIVPGHLDTKIFLAYALPPQGSRDYELARLAGYLLGGGATARLPLSVSHGRPLVSAAVVKTFGRAHGSSVGVIECPVVAGVDRDAVVVSVDAATSRPATDAELDRVKTSYLAEWIGETDSIAERADGISLALQLHGSPRPFFDHPAAVAAVTTADITRGLSFWAGSSRRFELVYLGD